jgi:hypothetical protein
MASRGRGWRGLLWLLLLAACGCSTMGRFDVIVTVEEQGFRKTLATIPSIEVHIVGISDVEYKEWASKSMTQYWEPDDALRTTMVRKGYASVMTFGEAQPKRAILYRSAAVWDLWDAKGSRNLFILANFPRGAQVKDQEGEMDARRRVLPLEKARWAGYFWGKRVIWVEVAPSGLICHTTPKPPLPPSMQ